MPLVDSDDDTDTDNANRDDADEPSGSAGAGASKVHGKNKGNHREGPKNEHAVRKAVVFGANVLFTTLISAGLRELKDVRIDTVIVDEAGQCVEPDINVALQHGASKLVLVGGTAACWCCYATF